MPHHLHLTLCIVHCIWRCNDLYEIMSNNNNRFSLDGYHSFVLCIFSRWHLISIHWLVFPHLMNRIWPWHMTWTLHSAFYFISGYSIFLEITDKPVKRKLIHNFKWDMRDRRMNEAPRMHYIRTSSIGVYMRWDLIRISKLQFTYGQYSDTNHGRSTLTKQWAQKLFRSENPIFRSDHNFDQCWLAAH